MLSCFNRPVNRHILRKGNHQRFAIVQHTDLLTLFFSKLIGLEYYNSYYSKQSTKIISVKADLLKAAFNILMF
jgi:hypothetical protein